MTARIDGLLDGLLDGLSPRQRAVVTSTAAPLAVVAGPGSGKTRVLTRRIAYRCGEGGDEPSHVLALTFSRRAAGQLTSRLGRLGLPAGARYGGVVAGTFHAVAWAQLTRHWADRGEPQRAILSRPSRILRPLVASMLGRDPSAWEVTAEDPEIAARYEQAKRTRGVLDLDDVLAAAATLLEDGTLTAPARWRHRHIYVDEYQDLNPAQLRLLHAWVADRTDVSLAGDPDQAIYGFNGAMPDLFERVGADWPGIETLTLDDNFRSSPEVVAAAALFGGAGCSTRPPGPVPVLSGYASPGEEARAVADAIAARRGHPWGSMAVLARTNARLRMVGAALDARGVPWRLRDPRPLADQPAVRALLREQAEDAPAEDLLAEWIWGAALEEFLEDSPTGTVAAFSAWLDASGVTAGDGPSDAGVDLATFHRAKGLEWPAVWVAGVDDGLVPLSHGDEAEERRLLYVALSRAGEDLAVSWSGTPSPWIPALEGVRDRLAQVPEPAEQRRRLQELADLLRAS